MVLASLPIREYSPEYGLAYGPRPDARPRHARILSMLIMFSSSRAQLLQTTTEIGWASRAGVSLEQPVEHSETE